jgi:Ca-activated chloride channel homolog
MSCREERFEDNVEFSHPILALAGAVVFLIFLRLRTRRFFGYSSIRFFAFKMTSPQKLLGYLPAALLYLTAFLLFLSLSHPTIKRESASQKVAARDILLVLDMSHSMQGRIADPALLNKPGLPPGAAIKRKIDMAKEVALDFVQKRSEDRIALMIFSDDAYGLWPLTSDHSVIAEKLNMLAVDGGYDFLGGTQLMKSLQSSLSYAERDAKAAEPILIYLSDGEGPATEDEIEEVALGLTRRRIHFYWLGMQDEQLEASPVARLVKKISHGRKFLTYDKRGLTEALEEISRIEKQEYRIERTERDLELYPYLCTLASLLVLASLGIKGVEL